MGWYGKDDETNVAILELIWAAKDCVTANTQLKEAVEKLEALDDSIRWEPPVRFPEGTII